MSDTTKVPAVEQGDLMVFKGADGKWSLVRIDYAVTRRWLSIARGKEAAELDAAIAVAEGRTPKAKWVKEPKAKSKEPAPKAPTKRTGARASTRTRRAAREPVPGVEVAVDAAPAV